MTWLLPPVLAQVRVSALLLITMSFPEIRIDLEGARMNTGGEGSEGIRMLRSLSMRLMLSEHVEVATNQGWLRQVEGLACL